MVSTYKTLEAQICKSWIWDASETPIRTCQVNYQWRNYFGTQEKCIIYVKAGAEAMGLKEVTQ